MKTANQIQVKVNRNGTNKLNRFSPFLQPSYIDVEERTSEDLLKLVIELSKVIKFYPTDGGVPTNWESVFAQQTFSPGNYPPHYALFRAFLEVLKFTQININTLTKRHLDFYFNQALNFKKRPSVPDRAHLIIDLAQSVESHFLKKRTLFKAGKDHLGKDSLYALSRDVQINRARLTDIKSLFLSRYEIETTDNEGKLRKVGQIESIHQQNVITANDRELKQIPIWPILGSSDMPLAQIGFAIASPLLFLEEGLRKIEIKIWGKYEGLQSLLNTYKSEPSVNDFLFELSTAEGWISTNSVQAPKINGGEEGSLLEVVFNLEIDKSEVPITAYDSAIHSDSFDTNFPLLKILINPKSPSLPYNIFRHVVLSRVDLKVDVSGVTNLILQNDQSILNAAKPFPPFGDQPTKGSSFYIGSKEIFSKELTSITLNLEWHDKPDSLTDHYLAYPAVPKRTDEDFTIDLSLLESRTWQSLKEPGKEVHLFSKEADAETEAEATPETPDVSASDKHSIQVHSGSAKEILKGDVIKTTDLEQPRDLSGKEIKEFDLKTLNGFMKMTLRSPDFGHKEFPSLFASTINQNYNDTTDTKPDIPKTPYTPTLRRLSLDYTSEVHIENDDPVEQFFHIRPFGWTKHQNNDEIPFLFPQYDEHGVLYMGFEDIEPDQEISILFQVAEATADPEAEIPEISWDYLSNNQWEPIAANQIYFDSTQGFNKPGLLTLRTPRKFRLQNTLLPGNKFWIRAKARNNATGVCKVIDIQPQAALVTFENQNNSTEHLAAPLNPSTINKLLVLDPKIKKVRQPFASFGGKVEEQDREFYQRISERLRHKDRAVTLWDYEHLTLEQFPDIYKVKAFNHSSAISGASVGHILLIVIPEVRNHDVLNPFKPMASLSRLEGIENYLENQCPPGLTIEVKNPKYEEIEVSFLVKFKDGVNRGFYEQQLDERIKEFLSPWAFEDGKDISFGSSIYKSTILNFVEEQSFVDFVTFFRLDHYDGEGNVRSNVEEAVATTPTSVLVSAPQHQITVLEDDKALCADGIGFMIVEETFTQIK